jgi:hypothetical protein
VQELPLVEPNTSITVWLGFAASLMWEKWPKNMKAVGLDVGTKFTLRGTCPYADCGHESAFVQMATHTEVLAQTRSGMAMRLASIMQCQACLKMILGIVLHTQNSMQYEYQIHFPIGMPDQNVPEAVPESIREDFKEALRCRSVDAYNATVEMCRRALESSCLQLGADEKLGTLQKMIDWVHSQGKITTPLCDMAHKIRLGGDRGAHPSIRTMGQEDADAVIEFTREYFDAIYVMPAKMAKFNFDRPKPDKTGAT